MVMSVEAIVVLAQQQNHIRIMRALRTIILVDTYLMQEVRRYVCHAYTYTHMHRPFIHVHP